MERSSLGIRIFKRELGLTQARSTVSTPGTQAHDTTARWQNIRISVYNRKANKNDDEQPMLNFIYHIACCPCVMCGLSYLYSDALIKIFAVYGQTVQFGL